MRAPYAFLAVTLLVAACDLRTEEAKQLEAKRLQMIQQSNDTEGTPQLRWATKGKHHTTFLRIQPFGSPDPNEIRAAMMKEMPNYDAGKELMEEEGWTHVGFRDRDTGIELVKPVSELRGVDAVMADLAAKKRAEEERQQKAVPAKQ